MQGNRVGPGIPAEDACPAAVGAHQAEQNPDCGGLAGPVRSEEPVHLAGTHAQVEPIQGPGGAESLDDVCRLDCRRWCAVAGLGGGRARDRGGLMVTGRGGHGRIFNAHDGSVFRVGGMIDMPWAHCCGTEGNQPDDRCPQDHAAGCDGGFCSSPAAAGGSPAGAFGSVRCGRPADPAGESPSARPNWSR